MFGIPIQFRRCMALLALGPGLGGGVLLAQRPAGLPGADTIHAASEGVKAPAPEFVLGPSDVIRVSVWKEPDLTQNEVISPDGRISIPLMGELVVAGLNVKDAQTAIAGKLRALVTDPRVTVTMLEVHSRQVYITGEISHPGAYPLARSMNLLQLIASAGGLTEYAHKKSIYLLRANSPKPIHFNYASVAAGKDREQNLDLVPGDTVVIP